MSSTPVPMSPVSNRPVGYDDLLTLVSTDKTPSSSAILDALRGVRGGSGFDQGKGFDQPFWLNHLYWRHDVSSPLHEAARRGHAEAVRILIEVGGMSVQLQEKDGKGDYHFPLYEAVKAGGGEKNTEVVRMLLYLGANPEENKLLDLIDLAREMEDEPDDSIFQILQEYKENRDFCDSALKNKTLQDVIAKEKAMDTDIERASDIQSKIEDNKKKIEELKTDEGYMTPIQKQLWMKEKDEIGVVRRSLMASAAAAAADHEDDESLACCACHRIPAKAFSCVACSHILCEDCQLMVSVCPRCRVFFYSKSRKRPQRNIAAERLILASLEKKRKMN